MNENYEMEQNLKVEIKEEKKSTFEKVERFIYLGAVLINEPNIKEEITVRLMAGNHCANARISKSNEISMHAT